MIDFLCKDYEKGQNHWEIQHNQFFEWFEEFSRLSDIQVLEKSTEKDFTASQTVQKQKQETEIENVIKNKR